MIYGRNSSENCQEVGSTRLYEHRHVSITYMGASGKGLEEIFGEPQCPDRIRAVYL